MDDEARYTEVLDVVFGPNDVFEQLWTSLPTRPRKKRTYDRFIEGDSNRCRNVYEKILADELGDDDLRGFRKKSKHISLGLCRHIAIVRGVSLPPPYALSTVDFKAECVPREEWEVPNDCRRFDSKILSDGFCFNNPCSRCVTLFSKQESA